MTALLGSTGPITSNAPASTVDVTKSGTTDQQIMLSLPTIHCAGCMSRVERCLMALPDVSSARVNLTLKRVQIIAAPTVAVGDLVNALSDAGFEAYELDSASIAVNGSDDAGRHLLLRLAVAGFAMMNVMLLSVAIWSGASDATRDLFHWISAAIALPAVAFSAQPFFVSAWTALRVWHLNMDVPISVAIILASAVSVLETAQSGEYAYFDAAVSLTFFLLAGRYLDHRTRQVAKSAAQQLAALEIPRATRRDGQIVDVADLKVGDEIVVALGCRIPTDGQIIDGSSDLDRSFITGETAPIAAGPGQQVYAADVNLTGPLTVRVDAVAEDSSLRRIANLVAMAETARHRYASLADRAAQIYAPLVHVLALIAFLGWFAGTGDARLAVNIAVAVLIITCPCALGLAVPAVTTAASGRLFQSGLLIKNATALERLAEIDTVVFDKTGTLTMGTPECADPTDIPQHALQIALALAQKSVHPLAQSLAKKLRQSGLSPAVVTDLVESPGLGVGAMFNGQSVRLGHADWTNADPVGGTATYLKIGDAVPVAFRFEDRLRPGARACAQQLQAQGKTLIVLSGDAPDAVADVAGRLGIERYVSGVQPDKKASYVRQLGQDGHKVLMIGDGLNDAAALAEAQVSISPASALEVTRVVSDMVLIGQSLDAVAKATKVAGDATSRIRENFAIAAVYNLIAVPIALAGFATPLVAALAMSASSITVSLNALRLVRR